MTCREAGRKGGMATVRKHGRAHMATIGAKGFLATCARHWQGDRRGFARWLHARAALAVADALADVALAAQLDRGQAVACVEVPAYGDPEEEDEELPW